MSGVVLTSASGSALPTARPDEQLKPMLPGPPVARRSFPQNDEIALFTEVYDNDGAKPHKVDITATVTTDEGKVLIKTDEVRDSSDLGGARGGYGYTTRIPLKDLAVGSYVLKIEAKSRLAQVPPAARELQFTVEASKTAPVALAAAPVQPTASPKAALMASTSRTIEKGDQSNVDEAKQVLVRTDAEWTRLWSQHSPDRPRPAVDFSKEIVVGVFMGSRPNAGFSTAVVSSTAANGALIVRYTETMPQPGSVTAQILTFPFHLVAIPKADVKDVKFEKIP
jgi:hypothetical protein